MNSKVVGNLVLVVQLLELGGEDEAEAESEGRRNLSHRREEEEEEESIRY